MGSDWGLTMVKDNAQLHWLSNRMGGLIIQTWTKDERGLIYSFIQQLAGNMVNNNKKYQYPSSSGTDFLRDVRKSTNTGIT